jgi:hypothetical protein
MEVRFNSQMGIIYGLIPATLVVVALGRWPRLHAPWAVLVLAGVWVWLTSRLAVAHWSSTHCQACGYPLAPLRETPAGAERRCPECGEKN